MRNSSLVKKFCADNVTGLKYFTETAALYRTVQGVGECRVDSEGISVRSAGIYASKNAGMSSEIPVKNRDTGSLRFPWLC